MLLQEIPLAVTITLFLFKYTHSKGIRRMSDFSEEFLKGLNYDNVNDIDDVESPMMEHGVTPGPVAIVLMRKLTEPKPLIKKPNNVNKKQDNIVVINNSPVQKPIANTVANIERNASPSLQMGEDSNYEDSEESEESEESEQEFDLNINRTNVDSTDIRKATLSLRSCSKKAFKRCKRACVNAHKNTCSGYYCSRRMKKTFRKCCKTSCYQNFI